MRAKLNNQKYDVLEKLSNNLAKKLPNSSLEDIWARLGRLLGPRQAGVLDRIWESNFEQNDAKHVKSINKT